MFNEIKKFTYLIATLSLLIVSCAKDKPIQEDVSLTDHSFAITDFNQEVMVEALGSLVSKEVKGINELNGGDSNEISDLIVSQNYLKPDLEQKKGGGFGYRKVKFLSGPTSLAKFVDGLVLETSYPGERFKVKFALTDSQMVIFAKMDEHQITEATESAIDVPTFSGIEKGYVPIYQYKIGDFGKKQRATNSLGEETNQIEFVSSNRSAATHVEITSNQENRQEILPNEAKYAGEIYTVKTKDFDTTAEYLYVPMTLGTPRSVSQAAPFYQGGEKIVKMKFSKRGLEITQSDRDPRFQDNDQNNNPVLFIPGEYEYSRFKVNK